jgi:iron complex transport system ATP-binding protein
MSQMPIAPALHVDRLTVRRGPVTILDNLQWSVPVGARCAILGPNGSGKTTLMRVITGFMWPTQGTVEVLGQRLGATDMRALRRRISVVDPGERFGVDPDITTLDAALTGYFGSLYLYEQPTPPQRQRAAHLLESVGLSHRLDHKFGLLSTGERRRCLMARALVHLPDLLILDEPTAGLDICGRERILATLDQLQRLHPDLTVLMVTHHVEEISPPTDQVLLLAAGRVAGCGRPEQVISPESLSRTFGCRVFVQKRGGRWWLEVLPEAWLDLLQREEGA